MRKFVGTFGRAKIFVLPYEVLEIGPVKSTGRLLTAKPLMSKSIVKASWQKRTRRRYVCRACSMGSTYKRKTYWKCGNQCKILHRNNLGEAARAKPIKF